MSTAAPKTFDPDLEHGTVLLADEILGDDHDVELAEEFAAATDRFEAAKAERNRIVGRLAEIAEERPLADTAARKRLSKERLELAGEAGFLPNDIAQAGEAWCNALIPWATSAYYSAKRRVAEFDKRIFELVEGNQVGKTSRAQVRYKLENLSGISKAHAETVINSGLPVNPEDIGADEDQRIKLEKQLKKLSGEIAKLRSQRDSFVDLEGKASHAMTSRFGQGEDEKLFEHSGPKQWLEALRSRTKIQVAPFIGGHTSTQPLQEVH